MIITADVTSSSRARVQDQLNRQARRHRAAGEQRAVKAPLTGKLFDASGEPMSPTFSRGKGGRLYRYYVSASLQQGGKSKVDAIRRLPAAAFESLVAELIGRWIPSAGTPLHLALSVQLRDWGLLIDMPANLDEGERIVHSSKEACRIAVPLVLPLRGGKRLITAGSCSSRPDPSLIAALRKAHALVSLRRGLPRRNGSGVSL